MSRLRCAFAVAALVCAWAVATSATRVDAPYAWQLPYGFPVPHVPADNPMTAAKVELGRFLFYDTRLSGNGTQSCATCHQQHLAFTDGRGQSLGSTGQPHPRGSMSLVNIVYAPALTWANPTLRTLEEQALVPMYGDHPVELGLSRSDEWLFMFQRDPIYAELFTAAFPGETVTRHLVVKALASFQRAIVSARSPYDRYHYAREETAISESAKRGEVLFHSRPLGCFTCHGGFTFAGAAVTARNPDPDLEFHNTGLYNLPGLLSYPAANPGLFEVTQNLRDVGKFKAPTLRNIAMTAPYMHDGSVPTLDEAIAHYAVGGRAGDNPNKSEAIGGFTLGVDDRRDLVAFLESLTDGALLRDQRFADPWKGMLRGGNSAGW